MQDSDDKEAAEMESRRWWIESKDTSTRFDLRIAACLALVSAIEAIHILSIADKIGELSGTGPS